jgi:hypothetical protein
MTMPRHRFLPAGLLALAGAALLATAVSAQNPVTERISQCSLVWSGHEDEIEKFLVEGKIEKMEAVPIGVTKPQRAVLEPGGPVSRFAWKQLTPGYSQGYMESYKAEIAAYKLDRMLDLHMVPPIVERTIEGKKGAAVFWIENTKSWDVKSPPQGPEPKWSINLTRMKMFDQLIANIDRNQGNLIYDDDWHLFLIDHSRAFTTRKDLKGMATLGRVDRELWTKMEGLTLDQLNQGLGDWVGEKEKKALLLRRDKMAQQIKQMVAKRGQSVFYD